MTMEVDNPALKQMGGKVQMEMWLSADVPGAGELHSFYQRNMAKFPWGLADLQRKVAEMHGLRVLEFMKMKSAGAQPGLRRCHK
jgi:hypothetical protein